MYLVTYLGALCNGLTLLIISKNLLQPSGNVHTSIHIVYGCNIKLIIVFLFLQVWLLSFLCHFSTNSARWCRVSLLYSRKLLTSIICIYFFIFVSDFFMLFHRSRWTTWWQKSNPTSITLRTCEYGAIFWQNVAVSTGGAHFYSTLPEEAEKRGLLCFRGVKMTCCTYSLFSYWTNNLNWIYWVTA